MDWSTPVTLAMNNLVERIETRARVSKESEKRLLLRCVMKEGIKKKLKGDVREKEERRKKIEMNCEEAREPR